MSYRSEYMAEAVRKQYADCYETLADSQGEFVVIDVDQEKHAAAEICRYIIWLGANEVKVDAQALAVLVLAGIREGRWWGEVAEDMGLPVPPEWEL